MSEIGLVANSVNVSRDGFSACLRRALCRTKYASKYRRANPEPENRKVTAGMASFSAQTPRQPRVGGDAAMAKPALRYGQGRFPARRTFAALDLGTNNCRMLIARPDQDGFFVVDAFSRIVRLGEGLGASGKLSDAAMDRGVAALAICAEKLVRRGVDLSRSVATEACRRATNGAEFAERVLRETGIKLDIITAEEEARLAVAGCHKLLEAGDGPALVFDIGGGSTELIVVDTRGDEPKTLDWLSVPWGVVSLAESEARDLDDRDDRLSAYARMRTRVSDSFREFAVRQTAEHPTFRLLGTSGTVTTLASVYLELPRYDRRQIDGLMVPSEAMRMISTKLSSLSIDERAELACIGYERADLVVAGCAILEAILDIWPAPRVGVADRGIREGILRQLMASDKRR
jgi:exopolyphosphatase / guanosine-5'-triphosphate,3'-diphosphate pyrophosphatase